MPYEMPDGQVVIIKDQRFRCAELLFNPKLIGKEFSGLSDLTFDSIQKCDIDVRRDLYSNIVMSGGSTMFTGIADRV